MKKILLLLTLLVSSISFSQAPEGINYQAVIRNASGNLITSTTVAIRVQVRQTTATGTVVYQERHSVLTSSQGLVNMVIGGGTVQLGTFSSISWVNGPFYVNLAVDFANGTNYQDFGTQQLMSVPYALYAKSSGNQLNQWRYGNTIPPSTLGNFGDFYLDVITGNVYYKNSGTVWVLTGNIKGPVGPTGLQGPAGVAGAQGPQGAIGATGPQGLIGLTGPQGPIGLTGPTGATGATGPQGPIGLTGPTGATGLQGPAGVAGAQGPQGVAGNNGTNGTNGSNGINGQNTLVKTTTESAGANCTTGGIKIEYGLDANNNGTLDIGEINATLTKYVCNGAVGATGPSGATGPQGAQGAQGPIGLTGVAGPTGATGLQGPIGLTGLQGIQGVAGTNGTNGLNALIKTTTESAGANCTNGGTKIETGLDANGNGVLDAGEVNASQTKYVCNGGGSTSNNFGIGVNAQHGYKIFTVDTFFVVNQNKLLEVNLRGGNGGNGGGNNCWGGGNGGLGSGAKFFMSVDQGDTINIKVGVNGINGCNSCVPSCGIPSGANGTNGSPSILSINSINHANFIVKANGGTGGGGGGPFVTSSGCGCWSAPGSGSNGIIQLGSNFNLSGIINFVEENGLGAFVSIRW